MVRVGIQKTSYDHRKFSKFSSTKKYFFAFSLSLGKRFKTFYVRNSRMFAISYSVCTWQAFPV
jgi:hypothetical protein